MFFPVYALLSSNAVVDPILYISTGSTTAVNLNVLTGGTEYLIGYNTVDVLPITVPAVQTFTTPGTYSWTAPEGVTSVDVVAVGGGSGGLAQGTGGAGGGLGWKNNISVTPGQVYTVVVGTGGINDGVYPRGYGPSTMKGGDSYFINTSTVAGLGGEIPYWTDVLEGFENARQTPGGGYVGDGGGNGGEGGRGFEGQNNFSGGGGAGGYSGPGGNGGYSAPGGLFYVPTAGTGGGGGGGYLGLVNKSSSGTVLPGGGGGVGLFGEGTSGTAAAVSDLQPNGATGGGGGSGGAKGNDGGLSNHQVGVPDTKSKGGLYGGGSGGGGDTIHAGGGGGAVAITWEQPRNIFAPDTQYLIGNNTADVPLSFSIDTNYLIGTNTADVPISFNVETEYLIGTNTADVPITITPGIYAQEFTTPGTYSWTAPAGVTSVSAVAVGGGGGGSIGSYNGSSFSSEGFSIGGGGGGLGWKNNIPVTPGQTYTVVVGVAGDRGPNGSNQPGSNGGDSYFINATTVKGGGGLANGTGGTYIGDSGGNGGLGRGGGGGAGGYSGNGGNGETNWNFPVSSNDASDGAGGGGGGGTCAAGIDSTVNAQAGGGGGGVGLRGQGTSGSKGQAPGQVHSQSPGGEVQSYRGGGGGSNGTSAGGTSNSGATPSGNAGQYGGGGGGWGTGYSSNTLGGRGGTGAVRIIWGPDAVFP